MLDKSSDVKYCGVRADKIKVAKPKLNNDNLILWNQWLYERYHIHLRKDIYCEGKPWTEDPILQQVKFTNVRREHDRTTIWLIDNICAEHTDLYYHERVANCILFRLYNKLETAELFDFPIWIGPKHIQRTKDRVKAICQEMETADPDYVYFTSAFNTGGMKAAAGRLTGEGHIPSRPLALLEHMLDDGVLEKIVSASSPAEVCDALMKYPGIGEFLSYQMFVDMTYILDFPFSENHFTISGPGCTIGLGLLFDDMDGMTPEECLFWLRDNQDIVLDFSPNVLMKDLPTTDRTMNVMSLENSFCEFGKYYKCNELLKEGRQPRARVSYDGKVPTETAKSLWG